jgi:predicted alpha/beta hydrolase family esterase
MTNYLIVPGLGDSGQEHWQTFFEKTGSNFHRIIQQEWDEPTCIDWITRIDEVVSKYDPSTVVLIGHSLGCSTIAHWAMHFDRKIKGALLVGPSDLEAPVYTFPATGFNPIPSKHMNFKTIVVASDVDPWVSIDRANFFASNWGSEIIILNNAGHINDSSGYGEWPQGLEILKKFD